LIENYNDSNIEICNLEYEIHKLEYDNSDLKLAIKNWISILEKISETDDINFIIWKIEKAIKELEFYI
jgi:hypothetical protein